MASLVLITPEGLDGGIDFPKQIKQKKLNHSSAIKAAVIILLFNGIIALDEEHIHYSLKEWERISAVSRTAARLEIGATEQGMQIAQTLDMLNIRGKVQGGGKYLIIKTKAKIEQLQKLNPIDGALRALENATHIYHGDAKNLYKWFSYFEKKKEMPEL